MFHLESQTTYGSDYLVHGQTFKNIPFNLSFNVTLKMQPYILLAVYNSSMNLIIKQVHY